MAFSPLTAHLGSAVEKRYMSSIFSALFKKEEQTTQVRM
jgi:hypothetical protein